MKSLILLTAIGALAIGTGCTHVARSRDRVASRLDEHSRAYTSAVVDALQLQPMDQRDHFTATALQLAQFDQRIEGIPLHPIAVTDLIDPARTNRSKQTAAAANLAARDNEVRGLLTQQRRQQDRLIAFGEQFEQTRNAQRLTWFKRSSFAVLAIGVFVTLFVFCPALIPVAGRLLAGCVARFPALAGGVGVVSLKAFDSLVKGIEQTRLRAGSAGAERFGNQIGASDFSDELLFNLSREMDAAHKALVRQRKTALKLDQ
jgi:hypothetical protein